MSVSRGAPATLFVLLLLSPLAGSPAGFDTFRLPLVLGVATLLLARMAWVAAHRPGPDGAPDPLLRAALLFAGAHLLSLPGATSPGEALPVLMTLGAGIATSLFARRAWLFSWGLGIPGALGLALAAVAGVQVARGGLPVSTLGNTNLTGALAAMLLPVAGCGAFLRGPGWRRTLSGAGGVALAVLLAATQSRGGLLAALGGIAVAAFAARGVPRARWGLAGGAVLVALLGSVDAGRHLSNERYDTARVRLEIWKGALRMVAQHPWVGCGAGGFAAWFPPYRSAKEFQISNRGSGADFKEVEDPHSSWMQILVETGVTGMVAFLLVLCVAARLWIKGLKTTRHPDQVLAQAGLGGGVAAYLGAGLFNTLTSQVAHTVLFWAWLGFIGRMGDPRPRRSPRTAVLGGAALVAALGSCVASMLGWMDLQFAQGMASTDPAVRVERFERALRLHVPYWPMYHELGVAYARRGRPVDAVGAYDQALRWHPFHAPALSNSAIELLKAGGAQDDVQDRLDRALAAAPYYHMPWYNRGLLEARRGRLAAARADLEESLRCKNDHGPSYYALGLTYVIEGRPAEALAPLRRAQELGVDLSTALRQDFPGAQQMSDLAEFFR